MSVLSNEQWKDWIGFSLQHSYLLPFIALNNERLPALFGFGARSDLFMWLCDSPSCGLVKISEIYLLDISVESVHIQNLNLAPFLCFSFAVWYKKKHYQNYYLGPLDLFFLTPMKPEGQLCSGV